MKSRAKSTKTVCVICGMAMPIEWNHVGGQNHVAWFTMPFCKVHHDLFHEFLRNMGVDLRHTPNELERLNRASQAIMVCQCMLNEAVKRAISQSHQG